MVCLSAGLGAAEAQQASSSTSNATAVVQTLPPDRALGPHNTIGDILRHPNFQGFARRLLPWGDRNYDASLALQNVGQLLPYHSAVEPNTVLAGLNRILEESLRGLPVFHEIYSDRERRNTPSLAEAGLFFFPGRPGAPFALIAPGGGFSYVGSVHEGFPYAVNLSDLGFNAFVVTYRTGQGGQVATADMARAIDYIMTNADGLGVAREGYSVWGSSAGARMAAFIGSHGPNGFGATTTQKPVTVVMAYTSHRDIAGQEPATYAIVGESDGIAPPQNMRPRVEALKKQGSDVAFRVVPNVGHGFGTGKGTPAEGWIREAAVFWQNHLPEDVDHPMDPQSQAKEVQ